MQRGLKLRRPAGAQTVVPAQGSSNSPAAHRPALGIAPPAPPTGRSPELRSRPGPNAVKRPTAGKRTHARTRRVASHNRQETTGLGFAVSATRSLSIWTSGRTRHPSSDSADTHAREGFVPGVQALASFHPRHHTIPASACTPNSVSHFQNQIPLWRRLCTASAQEPLFVLSSTALWSLDMPLGQIVNCVNVYRARKRSIGIPNGARSAVILPDTRQSRGGERTYIHWLAVPSHCQRNISHPFRDHPGCSWIAIVGVVN